MTQVHVGAEVTSFDEAKDWVVKYTTGGSRRRPYAYPYYDGLDTGGSETLVDGDFLAPTLLNARPSIAAFAGLQKRREDLDLALMAIPTDVRLADATDDHVELLGPLFGVLDDKPIYDVQGTILSKVLHRKRPELIPLYDSHIRHCYRDASGAPIPRHSTRTWGELIVLLAYAMRADLASQRDEWDALVALVPESQPLTALRCLDIVAWSMG
jgi:hypothetical protein